MIAISNGKPSRSTGRNPGDATYPNRPRKGSLACRSCTTMDTWKIKLAWQMRANRLPYGGGVPLRGCDLQTVLASGESNVTNDANPICGNSRCERGVDLDAKTEGDVKLHDHCHSCPSPAQECGNNASAPHRPNFDGECACSGLRASPAPALVRIVTDPMSSQVAVTKGGLGSGLAQRSHARMASCDYGVSSREPCSVWKLWHRLFSLSFSSRSRG